jgi:hypothetical protein
VCQGINEIEIENRMPERRIMEDEGFFVEVFKNMDIFLV